MNTINDEWETLVKAVMPDDAPAIQHREMRRAFYAGAAMMRDRMIDFADDSVSEDAAMALIAADGEEIDLFKLQILKGEA